MEKLVLGLDIGTTSIGWALVQPHKDNNDLSKIIKLGVRVNPLSVDEISDFNKGNALSTNADRTLARGARRNLQRFKQRRSNLIALLKEHKIITDDTILTENGKNTTHQTLRLRAKAASDEITLSDLAKVLLTINKKRGYKSSRKASSSETESHGVLIDGMTIARHLYEEELTPGQYVYNILENTKSKFIPNFYPSDLKNEFKKIWEYQSQFHSDVLTKKLFDEVIGKKLQATKKILEKLFNLVGIKRTEKGTELKKENYRLRSIALHEPLELEYLAIVLQEINNNLNKSSGYLGKISDRSKELYFNNETVGQNLFNQIQKDKHTSLKSQVFYRQDYLDEFERIWETQSQFHPILTDGLKNEIRDVVIFYQRKLKSQKHLISECIFEKHHKCIPKSSPLFQEFKVWQGVNNLEITDKESNTKSCLTTEQKQSLFNELNTFGNKTEAQILKILNLKPKDYKTNFSEGLEGNHTNQKLFNTFFTILENEGYGNDWNKKSALDIRNEVSEIFEHLGIDKSILNFDANIKEQEFDKQKSFQLWHLLYATQDDDKISEEDKLKYGNNNVVIKKALHTKFGFSLEQAALVSNITFKNDYGSLSSRAIRKIIPHLQKGNNYSDACQLAGYNHSNSLTKDEIDNRVLKDKMDLLPKNSLRNPVVEKILNQLVNLVNQIIKEYGKPTEVRIELARDLKQTASQRKLETSNIRKATERNDSIRKTIQRDFGFVATKNDVIKYRLWEELAQNSHKDIFTNTHIPREKIFSKDIDIEHIVPKALSYDDSFSNKTLAYRETNLKKGNRTGRDFIANDHSNQLDNYIIRAKDLFKKGAIGGRKLKNLLITQEELNDGFIARDLKNTQYIAKEAKNRLLEVFKTVTSTNGKITDILREDWGIINVMKELNLPKYRAAGLVETEERKNGKKIEKIVDWSKRNDHRHHAMDALAVAFTTYSHVQYINFYNARTNEKHKFHKEIIGVEKSIIHTVNKKKRFVPPFENFRTEAKKHIEEILVSIKAKNKVVTRNKNIIKGSEQPQLTLTPRGQLHKETVYKRVKRLMTKATKINAKFTFNQLELVANPNHKNAIISYLANYDNNINLAFSSKNLKKNPVLFKDEPLKEVLCFEWIFTIKKPISPDLKIEKVTDPKIKTVLNNHLIANGNDKKKAFGDLDENPIWLNKSAGIQIKNVTITGVSNAIALHHKKDHFGNNILDNKGETIPADFVSTGNNHHIAIYEDEKGKWHEKVVSLFEAVTRANQKLPIIDKEWNEELGWKFKFTMKQNEMFVFPNNDFDVNDIDLLDEKNNTLISKHLFRVQKLTNGDYFFRHHLETELKNLPELKSITWKRIGTKALNGVKKIRINHIGQIVQIGEY